MDTRQTTPEQLASSVIAVPPLARSTSGKIDTDSNRSIIRYLESGGIRTLLYGGNALFYHLRPSEYRSTCEMLVDTVADSTWVIPSVGPTYGLMMDHAQVLAEFDFPTAMVLPQMDVATVDGRATGIRHFSESWGRPIVLYLKHDGYLDAKLVKKLVDDGFVAAIKYAIVREDPLDDPFLKQVTDVVDPGIIVSGIGEQPAITHLRDFGLTGFTSGCVCIAPRLSQTMLEQCTRGDWSAADQARLQFKPLEDLRNSIHPIRVLHEAVELAKIAATGPLLPLVSPLDEAQRNSVSVAASQLKQTEASLGE